MTYVNCNAILAFVEDGFCLSKGLCTSAANGWERSRRAERNRLQRLVKQAVEFCTRVDD